MFQVIRKQVRLNTEIQFFDSSKCDKITDESRTHYLVKYKDAGKFVSSESTLSEDKLTLTTVACWANRDWFLEYLCDPIIVDGIIAHNSSYNTKHGIKSIIVDTKET